QRSESGKIHQICMDLGEIARYEAVHLHLMFMPAISMDDSQSGILMKIHKPPSNPIDNAHTFGPVETIIPGPVTVNTPEASTSGASLFATQTTVLTGIFLYQIPTYLFFELPGLKNPSSKLPPADTKVSPSFTN
ncbi:hypothetical protein RJ640_022200, partial [Escallonia rubra]